MLDSAEIDRLVRGWEEISFVELESVLCGVPVGWMNGPAATRNRSGDSSPHTIKCSFPFIQGPGEIFFLMQEMV